MSTNRNPLSDKELWQRFAAASDDARAAPIALSDMDFAAWLEGRLPEPAAARIEAAVAADADLRRAALDLADILGQPLPAAPPRMAVRAQALVGFEAERDVRGGSWLGRVLQAGASFGMPRAVMATAALLVAVTGFMLGGGLGESYAEQRYVVASNQLSEASNELSAFFDSDGI